MGTLMIGTVVLRIVMMRNWWMGSWWDTILVDIDNDGHDGDTALEDSDDRGGQ